ncbi:ABC transporter permease [Hwanghaeella grinnelliae]|uniref:ABC transporter permease n=1 Tax=Hwanghaeella grinnelliae TaxID=2500179 RepID=A0A437QUZ4_9PROT|nr:ABC transporter permease [Hwanghaeella grinnelliae]RVU38299.1 ABC transporter permease [Hwanghaeella grinnelliae]
MLTGQILTGLAGASVLFFIAAGLSLIFGVTKIVNFAHGSFYMLGAYIAYTLTEAFGASGLGFWPSILLSALAVGMIGALAEITVLKPVYKAPPLFQLLVTFGLVLIIEDLTLLVWGPEDRLGQRAPGLSGAVELLGTQIPSYDFFLIAAGPVVLGLVWLLLNKTRWGILVRAATEDREMAAALGIDQRILFTGVFFLGSALAGLGGALQLPKGGADLMMDLTVIAPAFVVVVVGGMGSLTGAYVAAVVIGLANTFGVVLLPQATLVLMFLVMAVVLLLRPHGLFGQPERAERGHTPGAGYPAAGAMEKAIWSVVLIGALLLPLAQDDFILVLATDIAVAALFATSLHFLLGPAGLVSFGHAAYFAIGAYAAALISQQIDGPGMEIALASAPVLAGAAALLFGWFCVRLSGIYFAMLTLAVAQIVWSLCVQWTDLTGGDDGLLGLWPSDWADSRMVYYYLTLALSLAAILLLRRAVHAPFGFALRAGRDAKARAEAIGIDVMHQQWLAFALAGAAAGLAGALFVFSKGSIFPDEAAIPRSVDALVMVLLGGVGHLAGPVLGSAAFTLLHDQLSRFDQWRLLLGIVIILVSTLAPAGLSGLPAMIRAFAMRRRI